MYVCSTFCLIIHLSMGICIANILYCEYCCYEHRCTVLSSRPCFQFMGCVPISGISESYGDSIFNIGRNWLWFSQQLYHFQSPPAEIDTSGAFGNMSKVSLQKPNLWSFCTIFYFTSEFYSFIHLGLWPILSQLLI